MACITISVDKSFKARMDLFPYITWSEVARTEALKKEIFERYMKSGKEVTDEDWKFCEQIDWHPVDELPMREEFIKKCKDAEKGPFIKLNSVAELFDEK